MKKNGSGAKIARCALALFMAVSILAVFYVPARVFAGESAVNDMAALVEAINTAGEGDTIKILEDIVVTDTITIPSDKKITLDLNGCTISQTKAQTTAYSMITNEGDLTIVDTAEGGKISYTDSGNGGEYISDTIKNVGVITLNSGTVENNSARTVGINGYPYAIDSITGSRDVVVNINGGTVSCDAYVAIRQFCNSTRYNNTLNVTDGVLNSGIEFQNPNTAANKGTLNITGGVFNTSEYVSAIYVFSPSGADWSSMTASVTGGEFHDEIKVSGNVSGFDTKFVTGGVFDEEYDVSGFIPDNYWQDEDGKVSIDSGVAKIGEVAYTSVQDAIDAAANGDTIVILKDVELDAPISVPSGKDVTIDLAGFSVSQVKECTGNYSMITNNGALTVTDTSAEKTGKISFTDTGSGDPTNGWGTYTISNSGTFTLENGVVENKSNIAKHAYYCITGGGDVIINGGEVINEHNYAIRIFADNSSSFTINGGKVSGTRALWVQLPGSDTSVAPEITVNVNGGELESLGESGGYKLAIYSYSYGNSMENTVFNISGGVLDGDVALTGGKNKDAVETVNVTGGELVSLYSYGDDDKAAEAITITGGTFEDGYAELYALDDGYVFTENNEGKFNPVEGAYVASVNGVDYTSVQDAIDAASAGDTVTLLADVEQTDTIVIEKDDDIILDLNGFTISKSKTETVTANDCLIKNKGTLTVTGNNGGLSYGYTGNKVQLSVSTISNEQGTLTIDGNVVIENTTSNDSFAYAIDSLTNGNLGDASVTVTNGAISSGYMGIRQYVNGSACSNTLNVTGGSVTAKYRAVNVQDAQYAGTNDSGKVKNAAVLNISGGSFTATGTDGYAVCIYGMTNNASISGGEFTGYIFDYGTYYGLTEAFISGGTYNIQPTEECIVDGYEAVENTEDNTWTVAAVQEPELDVTAKIVSAAARLYEPWGLKYFASYDGDDVDKIAERGVVMLKDEFYTAGMTPEAFRANENAYDFSSARNELGFEAPSTKYPNGRYTALLDEGIYSYDISAAYYALPYAVMENGQIVYGTIRNISMEQVLNSNLNSSTVSEEEKEVCTSILNLKESVAEYYAATGIQGAGIDINAARGSEQTAASGVKTADEAGMTLGVKSAASRLIEPWGLKFIAAYTLGQTTVSDRGMVLLCEDYYDASYANTPDAMRLNDNAYVFTESGNTLTFVSGDRYSALLTKGISSRDIGDQYYAIPYVVLEDGTYVYGAVRNISMLNILNANLKSSAVSAEEKAVCQDIIDLYNAVNAYCAAM